MLKSHISSVKCPPVDIITMEGYFVDSSSADYSLTPWKVLLLKDPLLTVSVAVESDSVESYCSVSHPMD